jgi:hypothetical protein
MVFSLVETEGTAELISGKAFPAEDMAVRFIPFDSHLETTPRSSGLQNLIKVSIDN